MLSEVSITSRTSRSVHESTPQLGPVELLVVSGPPVDDDDSVGEVAVGSVVAVEDGSPVGAVVVGGTTGPVVPIGPVGGIRLHVPSTQNCASSQ